MVTSGVLMSKLLVLTTLAAANTALWKDIKTEQHYNLSGWVAATVELEKSLKKLDNDLAEFGGIGFVSQDAHTDKIIERLAEYQKGVIENKGSLEPGTLSNVDTRKWYLEQEAKIPDLIDHSLPLEQQARQAFDLRNQYRTQARELMSDRQLAESLYATDPNLTWEQIIQKQIDKGLSGDDIYKAIIESSQRSRTSVNQSLGLE